MPATSGELFKNIRRIQIETTHLVNDLFAGAYRSTFKGKGIEFEDVREYQIGDDIRSFDWNVTARMNKPYIKNFREERELSVMLLVDVSASSRFGSAVRSKSELIAEIGAVLAFSAIKNNDKIGLILFSDIIEKYIPPKKGLRHVLRTIRELLAFVPKNKGTDIKKALKFLGKVHRRGGVCFLISDFLCPDFSHELKVTARGYDLISIAITDPFELSFPNMALTTITDLESGKKLLVDTADPIVQENYRKQAIGRLTALKKLIEKIGAGFIQVKTDQPYTDALRNFFRRREKRR